MSHPWLPILLNHDHVRHPKPLTHLSLSDCGRQRPRIPPRTLPLCPPPRSQVVLLFLVMVRVVLALGHVAASHHLALPLRITDVRGTVAVARLGPLPAAQGLCAACLSGMTWHHGHVGWPLTHRPASSEPPVDSLLPEPTSAELPRHQRRHQGELSRLPL